MKQKTTLFKTILLAAVMMLGNSQAWAGDVSTVYERGYTTAWASADIADDEWKGTNTSVDTENQVLVMSETGSNGTRLVTKTIDPTANSIITLDAQIYFGGGGSYNNKGTFKFGDNFEITSVPRNKSTEVKLNGTQVKSFTLSAADELLTINLVVNTLNNNITALSVVGSETTYLSLADIEVDKRNFAVGSNFASLTLQAVRGGSGGASVSIKKIKVQQETQTVTTYGYTVNYKEGDNVVKTVTGSLAEGAAIPVLTALDGEGTYDGQKYLIVADAAPVQTITSTPANNVLNVPVRKPYTTTLNVYRVLDGVKEAEPFITKPLTETDEKVANWVYTFPLCVNIDGAWYEATLKEGKFGEEGTFTNDALEKTIDYTLNADIVGFWDESHSGTVDNLNYSGGSMNTYWKETNIGTLEAGTYAMTAIQTESYSSTLYTGWTDAENPGTKVAEFGKDNRTQVFTLTDNVENVRLYRGTNGRMDYILLKKNPKVTVTIGSTGWATLYTPYALDFSATGLTAYTATCGGSSVTLTPVTNVPAGTGVVLKGAAKDYEIPAITSSSTDKGQLTGSATATTAYNAFDGYNIYALSAVNEGANVQFNPVASGNIAAGKAFLKIAKTEAPAMLNVVFAGGTTAISSVHGSELKANGYFDLQGRKVANPTKGLYIVNGKKIIVK